MAKAKTISTREATKEAPKTDGTELIKFDPWLEPYAPALRDRYSHYQWVHSRIDETGGIMGPVSQGHHYFGFNRGKDGSKTGVWYREWAPAAHSLRLIGDFNGWNRDAHRMTRDQYGVWSIFLP